MLRRILYASSSIQLGRFMQAVPAASSVILDPETAEWLESAQLSRNAIHILADPSKGYTKPALLLLSTSQVMQTFPQLPEGQRVLLEHAIAQAKQGQ